MRDSKPVCRSLDSITAVEQVEFAREFLAGSPIEDIRVYDSGYLEVSYNGTERHARVSETLWLISRGIYIGQFDKGEYILKEDNT